LQLHDLAICKESTILFLDVEHRLNDCVLEPHWAKGSRIGMRVVAVGLHSLDKFIDRIFLVFSRSTAAARGIELDLGEMVVNPVQCILGVVVMPEALVRRSTRIFRLSRTNENLVMSIGRIQRLDHVAFGGDC
jgi:hypothetical protein